MSWYLRLGYGVGQLPEGIKSAAFGFYLLFFFNQVLGLSGTLAGIAVFIALCIDALSDPIVGSWSDSTVSRYGRRHPFMYLAAIPFALSFYFLFVPPQGLGTLGLFIWLCGFAVLVRTTMTFYTVPYMALGAELTEDYDERTLLSSLRTIFQLMGMFAVLIGANHLFFGATEHYANGQLNPAAYPVFALAAVPLLIGGILVSALATHHKIPTLRVPTKEKFSVTRVVSEVRLAFKIPSFTAVVCASVIFGISQGMIQALILYTATYFFALTPNMLSLLFTCAIVGMICGSAASRPLSALMTEKKVLFIAGMCWYAFFTSVIIILKLLGALPEDAELVGWLYIVSSGFFSAVGLGAALPMIGSMIADITDEHERIHGERQEGIYYAAASFAGKMVGGAGPVLAGFVVDLAGIEPGATVASVPASAVARF
ncbi:MAG: MFS transporter, partial [Gammaproteobacteria bacterium]|nr:MFS transporter [Gammaproteobacteria bacterium]